MCLGLFLEEARLSQFRPTPAASGTSGPAAAPPVLIETGFSLRCLWTQVQACFVKDLYGHGTSEFQQSKAGHAEGLEQHEARTLIPSASRACTTSLLPLTTHFSS